MLAGYCLTHTVSLPLNVLTRLQFIIARYLYFVSLRFYLTEIAVCLSYEVHPWREIINARGSSWLASVTFTRF